MEENDVETKENNTTSHGAHDAHELVEPYEGMEFESEDDARRFYSDYAKSLGFSVRLMQRRHSEVDGKTLARRLSCAKNGFSSNTKGKVEQETKKETDQNAHEGCNATMMIKQEKSGKWVVAKFVKEHNHPLVVKAHEPTNPPEKNKKIQNLAKDLQRHEEQNAAYRDNLVNFLSNIENRAEHINSNVLAVVQNVRQAEAEALMVSKHR